MQTAYGLWDAERSVWLGWQWEAPEFYKRKATAEYIRRMKFPRSKTVSVQSIAFPRPMGMDQEVTV